MPDLMSVQQILSEYDSNEYSAELLLKHAIVHLKLIVTMQAENEALRSRVAKLNSICGRFSNVAYNVHQVDRPLKEHEKQSLKDLQAEYDALQRANQIEGGES